MKVRQHRVDRGQPHSNMSIKSCLPFANLVLVFAVGVALTGMAQRLADSNRRSKEVEYQLARTRAEIDTFDESLVGRIQDLMEVKNEMQAIQVEDRESYRGLLDSMRSRLSKVENTTIQRNETTVASVRQQIQALQHEVTNRIDEVRIPPKPGTETTLREFANAYEQGVVLIYTEFDYHTLRNGKKTKKKTVTGWGSGFVVTPKGHVFTNKHVVQPWKFDPDLAAMVALGEIVIDSSSLRICCWTPGKLALDDTQEPTIDSGFNNTSRCNLKIFAMSPDSMEEKSLEIGVKPSPTYKVHALDNNDLIILKLDGEDFTCLPLASHEQVEALDKLDPVMTIGYPRGQNGLERGIVTTSPSMGTIRKVEKTIHVTASIIPGNSGGPLVGPDGQVVGIITRIYSETLGICLKIEHAQALLAKGKAGELFRKPATTTVSTSTKSGR